jgi:PAS domain S-box-containing protein
MKFSEKGPFLGLVALVPVLLASALLTYWHTRQMRDDAARVNHAYAVLEALGTALEAVSNAEGDQRAFLLTGDRRTLVPYQAEVAKAGDRIEQLQALVQDHQQQAERVKELAALIAARLAELQELVAPATLSPEQVRQRVDTHLQHALKGRIRAQAEVVGREERILLDQAQRKSRRSYQVAVQSGTAMALLALGLVSLALALLRRHLRERTRFEEVMEQSEQRFRNLIQLSPDAIWIHRDDQMELLNEQAQRLLGLDSASQVAGCSPYDIFHPDCHAVVRERLRRTRAGEPVHLSMETLVCVDGSLRQVEVSSASFQDAKGQAVQVVVRDASERVRAESELRKVHRALRAVSSCIQARVRSATITEAELLREVCRIVNRDCGHPVVWVGVKEEDPAHGIRPAAAVGVDPAFLASLRLSWNDDERGQGVTARALRTGEPCIRTDLWCDQEMANWRATSMQMGVRSALALPLQDDGKVFAALTIGSNEVDTFSAGEVDLLKELAADLAQGIGTIRLRERQAIDAETLRESEERFRTAFETAAVPMSLTRMDGSLLRVNAAYCEMFGYTREEMETANFMALTHPEDRAATRAGVARLASGETRRFRMEKRYLRKDGTLVWGDMSSAWVPDAMGRPLYLITHVQDISERKRAEAELRDVNRRKDEFLATLAHELRNPLAPIRTGAFLLAQRGGADPEAARIHAMIATQSAHMARMIDELLDLARIESGKVDLRREPVDLGIALASALEACRPAMIARDQRVTVEVPTLPWLDADPVRLEQMLCNLLNNACKYTPPGGAIRIRATREDAWIDLGILDTGVGMSQEVMAHAFDLFYQAGQPLDRPEGGLGLGLTLVRQLAELHGGTVSATSEGPGKGSEFILRLPVAAAAGTAAPGPVLPMAVPQPAKRRVLIIDDDRDVRATSEMLLKAMNFQVTTAATGKAGIEQARKLRPDIALIDLGMPGLDGLEVGARIRQELGRDIYLVALTGYNRESDLERTRAAGFDRHMVKSGDPRELIQVLLEVP